MSKLLWSITTSLPIVSSYSTFEHKLRATHDFGRVDSAAVASLGVDGEGGVLADGVGVVVVVALPGVVVVVEDEVPSEEEHLRPHLAALAHPLSVQPDGQVRLGGQDGRVVLVRAVDDPAGDALVVVVLKQSREEPSVGITHLGYRAMHQASHFMLKWHQLHILRNALSFLILLVVLLGLVFVRLHSRRACKKWILLSAFIWD